MKLIDFRKVWEGNYLKSYLLTYLNKAGRSKTYEMVTRNNLTAPEDIGNTVNGITIIAICDHKLLLLREFRLGLNQHSSGVRLYRFTAEYIRGQE